MDPREYTRLLIQMLLLPLLALAVLAAGLAYSLQRMERSAAWVDHSDQVIGHANRILGLIVDQETGIRGYFLNRDPSFLEPYNRARLILPQEFDSALAMVGDNPAQTVRLNQLRRDHQAWQDVAQRDLNLAPAAIPDMNARKQQMDDIRVEAQGFLNAEETLRQQRSITANDISDLARGCLLGFIILIALITAWITKRSFSRCVQIFPDSSVKWRCSANWRWKESGG